jgi:hypothetical protein
MKRLVVLASLLAVCGAGIAALPGPATARGDKDCKDFKNQRRAQIFFLRHGGPRYDPDRLDGDHDGIACEDNPCPCYYKKHLPHHHRPARPLSADRLRRR